MTKDDLTSILATKVAVWIIDQAIYDHQEIEIRSFSHLQSLVDANEYLQIASEEWGFDNHDYQFMNTVIDKFDQMILNEIR